MHVLQSAYPEDAGQRSLVPIRVHGAESDKITHLNQCSFRRYMSVPSLVGLPE